MDQNNPAFVGMGVNPETGVPDIPYGLGMALSQNTEAKNYFGRLSKEQKAGVIRYVQSGKTGEEARQRIQSVADNLKEHKVDFI
jgi:uncharacterized protein YdeI (YjbR/CyaY-like superfamily)